MRVYAVATQDFSRFIRPDDQGYVYRFAAKFNVQGQTLRTTEAVQKRTASSSASAPPARLAEEGAAGAATLHRRNFMDSTVT
jgi:hypothetical protein